MIWRMSKARRAEFMELLRRVPVDMTGDYQPAERRGPSQTRLALPPRNKVPAGLERSGAKMRSLLDQR
jgi:hypothetical protein